MKRTSIIVLLILFFVSACSSVPRMTNYNSIDSAYIGDSGLKIVSQDGEFTLKKGSFKVPFQSSIGYSYNQNLAVNHSGSFIISRYNEALMIGAKKVMVYTDYSNTPIYGVLLFNPIPSRVSGPEARSYSIRVPSNYVSLAKGGNVSVVYEAATITGTQYRAYTWVLWMSDIPF